MLEDFLGRGLFNSDDGEQWLWRHKNASLEFTKALVPQVRRRRRAGRGLQQAAPAGTFLDAQDVLEQFAFDTICMLGGVRARHVLPR
jgi:cytochrome P450